MFYVMRREDKKNVNFIRDTLSIFVPSPVPTSSQTALPQLLHNVSSGSINICVLPDRGIHTGVGTEGLLLPHM